MSADDEVARVSTTDSSLLQTSALDTIIPTVTSYINHLMSLVVKILFNHKHLVEKRVDMCKR